MKRLVPLIFAPLLLSLACSVQAQESPGSPSSASVPGFHGRVDSLETVSSEQAAVLLDSKSKSDIDLISISASAMNYLIHNPLSHQNCECRFDISPSYYPLAIKSGEDAVAIGDTEVRMLRAFLFMRDMNGNKEGADIEATIRKRVLGYINDDGMSYCRDCNTHAPESLALNWTMSNTLSYVVEDYKQNKDPKSLALAKKLVGGMKKMANWDTGRAFYAGGLGGWDKGEWTMTGCANMYPCIVEPIMQYYDISGDKDALAFAAAFSEGTIAGLQPTLAQNAFQPDGSFAGQNSHLHMRAVVGVVHLGVDTGNSRYVEWGRRVYDFLMNYGTEWGWFSEGPPPSGGYGGAEYAGRSETCIVGDMSDMALWLAKAGYTARWDDLERFVRNYLREAQFFVTPEYKAFYTDVRTARKNNPGQVADGLQQATEFEGGFVARLTPNSLVYGNREMNMMGCCPPEAMRSLYTAWSNIVMRSGKDVFVNMSFNRDAPDARIEAYTPDKGRLTAIVKKPADFFLRPPSWAARSGVKAFRGEKEVPAVWSGDYIKFANASKGENLTITYSVITFRQTVQVAGGTYTYRWVGNTVVGVEPIAPELPLFSGKPSHTK